MVKSLGHNQIIKPTAGPVICCVLDGVGLGKQDEADAVHLARTPTLDWLMTHCGSQLTAHGTSVGLPTDSDMGNSEVGHNVLGCGRVYDQGALLINRGIASGSLYDGDGWQSMLKMLTQSNGTLHFLGLLSDGNVHSHINHLLSMTSRAVEDGMTKIAIHILLDGRDVEPVSALKYIEVLESHLEKLRSKNVNAFIASGGGRMTTTMDRYEANWGMVEQGWKTHVLGEGRKFANATEAVETLRSETPGIVDQNMGAFVIANEGKALAPVHDGDAVINFNFRGDRAIEISRAFDEREFSPFDRRRHPDCLYLGMMEYDGDLHVPKQYLADPPSIIETMGEYLAHTGIRQLAISETQKFGHVTYFWNGNKSGMFDESLETYVEVKSDSFPFDQRPWMKAADITDDLISRAQSGDYRFIRVNYANGDMVGHTGNLAATVMAVEIVDFQLARLKRFVEKTGGTLVVTADHGNADEMFQRNKDGSIKESAAGRIAKTSHTLSPVPFCIYSPTSTFSLRPTGNLSSVAATCIELLGLTPPKDYSRSLLRFE